MPGIHIAAVCAHPDDAETLAGGTLRREVERGRRVALVDLSAGERGSRGTPQLRAEESGAAALVLGVAHRECLGLPDAGIGTAAAHRDHLVEALRRLRPAIVITHHPTGRHPDHDATSRLVIEAAHLAGLANYLPGAGAPFRPSLVLHALATLHPDPAPPAFVVDITVQWPTKLLAVRAYASQFLPAPGTPANALDGALESMELAARWHGRSIGVARGEGFVTAAPLAVADLCSLVPPGD